MQEPKYVQPAAQKFDAPSDGPTCHGQKPASLQREAWTETVKEWIDARGFLRQRRQLLRDPKLAFVRHYSAQWKPPFRFAVHGGVLLALLFELSFVSWRLVPAHYRFRFLDHKSDEILADQAKLEKTKKRIESINPEAIDKRIDQLNRRIDELRILKAHIPAAAFKEKMNEVAREREEIVHQTHQLEENYEDAEDTYYRQNPPQLEEDIQDNRENIQHLKELKVLLDEGMEYSLSATAICYPFVILLFSYGFRALTSLGLGSAPASPEMRTRTYLYLVVALQWWYWVIAQSWGFVSLAMFSYLGIGSSTKWFGWLTEVLIDVIIMAALIRLFLLIKKANKVVHTGLSPTRVVLCTIICNLAGVLVLSVLCTAALLTFAWLKAPWMLDALLDT